MPLACRRRFRERRSVSSVVKNEPLLILAALVTVYIVLGVLYESYIHPITILSTLPSAGVGAILALLVAKRTRCRRAHRNHLADRHREKERDHDDRLRTRSGAERRQEPAGRDLPGLSAAVPADHDDHDGRAVRRFTLAFGNGVGAELRRHSASPSSADYSLVRSSRCTRRRSFISSLID